MTPEEKAATAEVTARAVAGVNDAVEKVSKVTRGRIRRALRALGPAPTLPMASVDLSHRGVHSIIRHGSQLAGSATAAAMRRWADPNSPSVTDTQAGLAGLAGVGAAFGDNLPAALGPPMSLHAADDLADATAIAVFAHGLGGHEQQWSSDYALACAHHGIAPIFIRYTTGKAIENNARELDQQLRLLVSRWSGRPLRRIVLVGHSMGGLVAAQALQSAGSDSNWLPLVTDLVTLGSPLTGAPLERVSNAALNVVISRSGTAAPIAELGHRRSAGIKDLAHGISDPVPEHVSHWAVVAAVGATTSSVASRLIGDGIVPTASARGRHHVSARVLIVEIPRAHHLDLLNHPAVTALLAEVVAPRVRDRQAAP